MARFDVFANPDKSEHSHTPFVLDVQNDHLSGVETRVVIPLRDVNVHGTRLERLQPAFSINGRDVVMDTPTLATFPRGWLRTAVASLRPQQSQVQEALDTLFGSY
jgi:toxin CcdB